MFSESYICLVLSGAAGRTPRPVPRAAVILRNPFAGSRAPAELTTGSDFISKDPKGWAQKAQGVRAPKDLV